MLQIHFTSLIITINCCIDCNSKTAIYCFVTKIEMRQKCRMFGIFCYFYGLNSYFNLSFCFHFLSQGVCVLLTIHPILMIWEHVLLRKTTFHVWLVVCIHLFQYIKLNISSCFIYFLIVYGSLNSNIQNLQCSIWLFLP